MGKIKRRKLKSSRYTPILQKNGTYSETNAMCHNLEANASLSNDCNIISDNENNCFRDIKQKSGLKSVLDKISSDISEEKITGLNIMASFALEENVAAFIVNDKIVATVAPLLQDCNPQVRLATAGVLRNLCLTGSDEVVDMMIQQDILSPLSKLLKEYISDSPSDASISGASCNYSREIATTTEDADAANLIFIHATNLLWNLCECSEEAIRICNQESLATAMVKHISPFVWNYSVALAAADCLLCISENNPRTSSIILPSSDSLMSLAFESLSNSCNPASLRFAVTVSGILVNLDYWTPGGSSFRKIFEILAKVLETDAVFFFMDHSVNARGSGKNAVCEEFEHLVAAQLLALEILSNICCPDEEEEFGEYEENSSEEDMADEESMVTGDQENVGLALQPEVMECIKYYGLVDKTLKKLNLSNQSLCQDENENTDAIDKLKQLQIRALQCFQNLVSCLDIEDFGGVDAIYSVWLELGKVTFIYLNKDDRFMEASSGAMRAIIDKLASIQSSQLVKISQQELQPIFSAGLVCSESTVRANLSRMVGILGCLLIQRTAEDDLCTEPSINIVAAITDFLFKIAEDDSALWVSAEALDVIIDLFSDDKTDKLAGQLSLIDRLKGIQPQFKAKYKKVRKQLGDHRPLVVTVRDNLLSFIKYKGPRTTKCSQHINKMVL